MIDPRVFFQDVVYLHCDRNGRLYFDKCQTDDEHLEATAAPGAERVTCRVYLDRLAEPLIGKKGFFEWRITRRWTP